MQGLPEWVTHDLHRSWQRTRAPTPAGRHDLRDFRPPRRSPPQAWLRPETPVARAGTGLVWVWTPARQGAKRARRLRAGGLAAARSAAAGSWSRLGAPLPAPGPPPGRPGWTRRVEKMGYGSRADSRQYPDGTLALGVTGHDEGLWVGWDDNS
jgi:hypothetical protein